MAKLSQKSRMVTPPASTSRSQASQNVVGAFDHGLNPPTQDVLDNTNEEDHSNNTVQTASRRRSGHAGGNDKRPRKRQRKNPIPRMLHGLDNDGIITPQISGRYDSSQFSQRMTGLKEPSYDGKATRRSGRAEARKPRVYNMKIHPQDHSLPYRRATPHLTDDQEESEHDSQYESQYESGEDDAEDELIVTQKSDETVYLDDDTDFRHLRGLKVPMPNPLTTRRSARDATKKAVNYNQKMHPNDIDIGWPSRRPAKQTDQSNVSQRRSCVADHKTQFETKPETARVPLYERDDEEIKETRRLSAGEALSKDDGEARSDEETHDVNEHHHFQDAMQQSECEPEDVQQDVEEQTLDDEMRYNHHRSRSQTVEHTYHDREDSPELSSLDQSTDDHNMGEYLQLATQAARTSPVSSDNHGLEQLDDSHESHTLSDLEVEPTSLADGRPVSQRLWKVTDHVGKNKENSDPRRR
ncbi:hypothetical protein AMS68_004588 [Peltaster fructicola]|uniref:Uncharacterized protein n=1 Tax=Peltaster fructicola TaxID=286661 RepID=A0A6H0XWN1_9PEZI|nr:hypothetical protein AMS68_004588 [Peltaster fructicola]